MANTTPNTFPDADPGPIQHPPPPTFGPPHEAFAVEDVPEQVPETLLPALKAQAARESGGCDEVRIINVAGIDHDFVLRRPSKREWDIYLDAAFQPAMAIHASRELAANCCVWPPVSTMKMIADERRLPALPMRLCDELELWCGYSAPREFVIDANTQPSTLHAAGIDPSVVAALVAQYPHKGQLRACTFTLTPTHWGEEDKATATVIVKRPEKGVYESFVLGFQGTGKAAASHEAALACCVYPASPEALRRLFADVPGIPVKLADVIATLGGATVRTTAKKA